MGRLSRKPLSIGAMSSQASRLNKSKHLSFSMRVDSSGTFRQRPSAAAASTQDRSAFFKKIRGETRWLTRRPSSSKGQRSTSSSPLPLGLAHIWRRASPAPVDNWMVGLGSHTLPKTMVCCSVKTLFKALKIWSWYKCCNRTGTVLGPVQVPLLFRLQVQLRGKLLRRSDPLLTHGRLHFCSLTPVALVEHGPDRGRAQPSSAFRIRLPSSFQALRKFNFKDCTLRSGHFCFKRADVWRRRSLPGAACLGQSMFELLGLVRFTPASPRSC